MTLRKTLTALAVASTVVLAMAPAAQAMQLLRDDIRLEIPTYEPTHNPNKTPKSASAPSTPVVGVCFYTEVNFGGRFFCDHGQRRVSEVDPKWRDDIESVQIINSASVVVCEDFNRKGTCQTLSNHDPELSSELLDHLYSYKIKR